jgi:hypothetical protein
MTSTIPGSTSPASVRLYFLDKPICHKGLNASQPLQVGGVLESKSNNTKLRSPLGNVKTRSHAASDDWQSIALTTFIQRARAYTQNHSRTAIDSALEAKAPQGLGVAC